MKAEIHPTYYPQATFTCSCGAVYRLGSTKPEVHVEICSQCHPFFSGEEKVLDTAGRVERFKTRRAKADPTKVKTKKVTKKSASTPKAVKSAASLADIATIVS